MVLKVNFVSPSGHSLASHRMRVLEPANILNCSVKNLEVKVSDIPDEQADINVFFKHFNQDVVLDFCSKTSKKVIFDVCDNHFDREHKDYYLKMVERANVVTCNTDRMQTLIKNLTNRNYVVTIPDPITFPQKSFNTCVGEPRVIWFGHVSNAKPLLPWLPVLKTEKVTAICNSPLNHPKISFIPWKMGQVEHTLTHHHIVIIPTSKETWTHTKSPNRAVDAISAGKLVITDDKYIYGELGNYIEIVSSPEEASKIIEGYVAKQDYYKEKIEKGQAHIKEFYGPKAVLESWLTALELTGLVKEIKDA